MYEVTAPHSSARRSLLFCASPQRRRYTSDEIEIRRLGIRSVRNGSSDRPGDDFFRYANGTWINKRQIPPDKPAYSLRLAMTDLTEQRLHEMFEFSLFTLMIYADLKDPHRYAFYLIQAGIGLPDRDYYLKPEFAAQKTAYQMCHNKEWTECVEVALLCLVQLASAIS
ncbi:MAG: hypothetical protein DME58_04825 [Verrucomicrobia bacterium]|nr:MAG: hypothetical protein DME58_04825 [Verrucomicrobiota bacterium]